MTVTESGNLVLFDGKNLPVWESFSHPTDCLLPGQQLVEGMRLTPNASATNWTSNSQLYVTVRADGVYAFVESSPPQLYYQKTVPKSGNRKTYMTLTNDSVAIFASSSSDNVTTLEAGSRINMTAGEMGYIRLESDGHLKLYKHKGIDGWMMVQDILKGQVEGCAYPTVCGEYGICNNGQCTCPIVNSSTYFKQIDDRKINLGCAPVTPISCTSMQDHKLLALSNVSYFNYVDSRAALPQMVDEESCKKACLRDCSCKAAFFQYGGNDTSQGSCYLPKQVFSLQVNQWEVTHYSSSAYLKVQITRPPPSPSPSKSNGTANRSTPTGKKRISAGAIAGLTVAGVVSLLTVIIITLVVIWRRYQLRDDEDDFGEVPGMATRFTFEQLRVATEQFTKLLGKGGFGSVFEGQVGEQRIAVKQLDRAGQGKKEFLAEVETIGNIHHINLVRLIGFCAEKSQRLLVYEYMSKGSLDQWIYLQHADRSLDWHTRCRIVTDIAKGLAYLHEECRQRIAHLDIKPQNILLDGNFNAKLSDFGLSKMIDRDKSQVITRMRGTPGYLAPEWLTSQITEKADIYSFGIVVMEIISGRKNLDYSQPEEKVHLISLLQEKARIDQLEDLIEMNGDEMQIHKEEVIQMMKLAMWCLQIDYNKRPQMSVVVKVLEGTMNVETNIEFNFVAMVPHHHGNDGKLGSSAPLLASHLSGPR
jgi:predicted Ser/Thr protein kinase